MWPEWISRFYFGSHFDLYNKNVSRASFVFSNEKRRQIREREKITPIKCNRNTKLVPLGHLSSKIEPEYIHEAALVENIKRCCVVLQVFFVSFFVLYVCISSSHDNLHIQRYQRFTSFTVWCAVFFFLHRFRLES